MNGTTLIEMVRAAVSSPVEAAEWIVLMDDVATKAGVHIGEIANPIVRVIAVGKLDVETLNELTEKGVELRPHINEILGHSYIDAVSRGEVTSDMFKGALQRYVGNDVPPANSESGNISLPNHKLEIYPNAILLDGKPLTVRKDGVIIRGATDPHAVLTVSVELIVQEIAKFTQPYTEGN